MTLEQALKRIADLEEQNAWLRSELGLVEEASAVHALRNALRLSTQQARVVLRLYRAKGRVVPFAQLYEAAPPVYSDDRPMHIVRVFVSQTRAKLGKDFILGSYGLGYALSPAAAETIRQVLEPQPQARAA